MKTTVVDMNAPKAQTLSRGTTEALSEEELRKINAYWRACNYLAAGMIYLHDNPLLRESLKTEHIKARLLGHWSSNPGLSFTYTHLDVNSLLSVANHCLKSTGYINVIVSDTNNGDRRRVRFADR